MQKQAEIDSDCIFKEWGRGFLVTSLFYVYFVTCD